MKKQLAIIAGLMAAVLTLTAMPARAEIAPEILRILQRSDEVMSNQGGVRMDMSVKVSMLVFSFNMNVLMMEKDDKSKAAITATVLGKEVKSEEGCDGVQAWEYKKGLLKGERDTLILSPCEKSEYSVDMSVHEDYENAKMALKKGVYEITLTDPKDKEMPKKTIFRIHSESFHPLSMEIKDSGLTMVMKINNITFGVPDEAFVLNMADYPDAVVVKKFETED